MTRNPHTEAAALRARLRDSQTRLNLLAALVLQDTDGARALARLMLSDPTLTLGNDGVSQWPPSSFTGEPAARQTLHTKETDHG